MRVLLIEDQNEIAGNIECLLSANGFIVDLTGNSEDGIELANIYNYDLIILDNELTSMSGIEIVRKLRGRNNVTPILALVCAADQNSLTRLLQLGADDCVQKPFADVELLMRTQAVVRRVNGHASPNIALGDLLIDLTQRTASINGMPVHFTRHEYSLLELLAFRRGKTVDREAMLNYLYDGKDDPISRTFDVFLHRIRQKIALSKTTTIETVRGRGYAIQVVEKIAEELKPSLSQF